MEGIDVSSYQSGLDVSTTAAQFVVIKATEGTGYVNPHCDTHYQQAKASGKLRGVYHFLANKVNNAKDEAAYFVQNCSGYIGDALLALDNENSAYNDEGNVGYVLEFLQEVERLTGVKPLLYMNASCTNSHDWSPVYKAGFALWVAAYQSNPPDVNWPNEAQAMWQYTSTPIDHDRFWGDAAAWQRFAAKPAPAPTAPQPAEQPPAPAPASDTPPAPVTPPAAPQQPTVAPAPTPAPIVTPVPPLVPVVTHNWLMRLLDALLRWLLKD